jgi:cytoskeletal protein CcmA (bactofilin family)
MLNLKSFIKREPVSIFYEDCVLEGQIHFGKKTTLYCPAKGDLSASGAVEVTEKCQIEGNADFYSCELKGTYVGGNMTIHDNLVITPQSKFNGSAMVSVIEIQPGADFQIDLEILPLLGDEKKVDNGLKSMWSKVQNLWKK